MLIPLLPAQVFSYLATCSHVTRNDNSPAAVAYAFLIIQTLMVEDYIQGQTFLAKQLRQKYITANNS
jgi:hypothetical protein